MGLKIRVISATFFNPPKIPICESFDTINNPGARACYIIRSMIIASPATRVINYFHKNKNLGEIKLCTRK
jgi:hypothetical protein